jgi:hypothetical protein
MNHENIARVLDAGTTDRLVDEINRPERAGTCQPRASIREFHERLRRPGLPIESSHKALKGRHKRQTGWPGVIRRATPVTPFQGYWESIDR